MIAQTVYVNTGVPISGTAITNITPPANLTPGTGGVVNAIPHVSVVEQANQTGFLYVAGAGMIAGNLLAVRVGNQQTALSQPYYITVLWLNTGGQAVPI